MFGLFDVRSYIARMLDVVWNMLLVLKVKGEWGKD